LDRLYRKLKHFKTFFKYLNGLDIFVQMKYIQSN